MYDAISQLRSDQNAGYKESRILAHYSIASFALTMATVQHDQSFLNALHHTSIIVLAAMRLERVVSRTIPYAHHQPPPDPSRSWHIAKSFIGHKSLFSRMPP